MIKINGGDSHLEGTPIDIISEYTCVTKHIVKAFTKNGIPEDLVWDLLRESQELAKATDDELEQKKRELLVMLMMKLFS